MFTCTRISDAVRMAVYFNELREARMAYKGRDMPIQAYLVDSWKDFMETQLDRVMGALDRD
jgi:hypothetical protein